MVVVVVSVLVWVVGSGIGFNVCKGSQGEEDKKEGKEREEDACCSVVVELSRSDWRGG